MNGTFQWSSDFSLRDVPPERGASGRDVLTVVLATTATDLAGNQMPTP